MSTKQKKNMKVTITLRSTAEAIRVGDVVVGERVTFEVAPPINGGALYRAINVVSVDAEPTAKKDDSTTGAL